MTVTETLPFSPVLVDFSQIDAVVFDIGGVFLYPHYSAVKRRMEDLGLAVPENHDVFRQAHHGGVRKLWEGAATNDEHREDFWRLYDTAYVERIGVPPDKADDVSIAMRATWSWPHPENIAAFGRLAAGGMPVAIVSNNNGTAPNQMWDHRVCQVGEGPNPSVPIIVDSAIVGIAKPDPAIFTPALEALGTEPGRTLYVGDTIHADVQGASAANMPVAQLDPFDDHADYPHTRLRDLDHLNEMVGC